MSNKDVNFSVGAEGSDVDKEFERIANASMTTGQKMASAMRESSNKMQEAFKENTDRMNTVFDNMKGKIEAMRGQLAAVAGVVVGAKWLKGLADDSATVTIEHIKLAAQLGISTSAVQVFDMAVGDAHGTIEDLKSAHAKINQTLLTNEDAFKKLGVATRDGNGNFRSTMEIMVDTNAALLKFKEGTDRNIEGAKIYSKSWQELGHIVNLTQQMFDEAEVDARRFGLVIGQESIENAKNYEKAMGDVSDITTGLKKAIGDALMPVLTQFGEWMATAAPAAITVTKGAIGGLVSVFWGFKLAVETVIDLVIWQIEKLSTMTATLVTMTMRALQGDWSGAQAAWDLGQNKLYELTQKHMGKIVTRAEETKKKIWDLFANPTPVAAGNGATGTSEGGDKKETKAKSRTSDWDARLQEMKDAFAQEQLAQNQAHEFSKQAERDYWRNILDTVKMSQEERRAVFNKYIAVEKDLQKQNFDQQIADLKDMLAAASAGGIERIRVAGEIAAAMGKQYGLESQQYKQALADMRAAAKDHQAQMQQLEDMARERRKAEQLSQIELERQTLDQQLAMGDINNMQRLGQLAILKEQEFQIELQAAMDRAALLEQDSVAYQAAMDKVLEIKRKHELDKKGIENEMAKQNKADYDAMFEPVSNAFSQSIRGMIQGTQTLRDVTRNALLNIAGEYATIGVRMLMQWIANQARMTMATAAGAQTRVGIDAAAAAQSTAISGQSTLASIMNDAYEAMAGAYSAIAGIPFVGPFLAPVVAAGAFATVAGLAGSVMSAEGGYDIPGGTNPMTQLHEREMVLPSQHADVIRALGERGGIGSGGGQSPIILRGASAGEFFIANKKELARALKSANRDFIS
jgi:hypothetical protein